MAHKIANDPFFSLFVFLFFPDEAGGNLTSLLVQPISAFLAKALLSCVSMENGKQCVPLAMPPNAGKNYQAAFESDPRKFSAM